MKKVNLWDKAKEAASSAGRAVQQASDSVQNLVKSKHNEVFGKDTESREMTVRVFLVHRSHDKNNYEAFFDLKPFVTELEEGRLKKPKIVIVAGRPDMDRDLLSSVVTSELQIQFMREKNSLRTNPDKKNEEVLAIRKSSLTSIATLSASGLIAFLLRKHPLANTIIIALAFLGGPDIAKLLGNLAISLTMKATTAEMLEQAEELIQKQLKERKANMVRSAKMIPVTIDKRLHEHSKMLCNMVNKTHPPVMVEDSEPSLPQEAKKKMEELRESLATN